MKNNIEKFNIEKLESRKEFTFYLPYSYYASSSGSLYGGSSSNCNSHHSTGKVSHSHYHTNNSHSHHHTSNHTQCKPSGYTSKPSVHYGSSTTSSSHSTSQNLCINNENNIVINTSNLKPLPTNGKLPYIDSHGELNTLSISKGQWCSWCE